MGETLDEKHRKTRAYLQLPHACPKVRQSNLSSQRARISKVKIVRSENMGQDLDQVDGKSVTEQNCAGDCIQGLDTAWGCHAVCHKCENSLIGTDQGNWLSQATTETMVLEKDSVVR